MPLDRQLQEYIDIARRMPPPETRRIFLPYDEAHITCACGVRCQRSRMPVRNSKVVKFTDVVCGGCTRRFKAQARIVCANCREVVALVDPGRDPKDRFTFESGAIYHVLNCDICTPGLPASDLIERILWRRANNIPNPLKTS